MHFAVLAHACSTTRKIASNRIRVPVIKTIFLTIRQTFDEIPRCFDKPPPGDTSYRFFLELFCWSGYRQLGIRKKFKKYIAYHSALSQVNDEVHK